MSGTTESDLRERLSAAYCALGPREQEVFLLNVGYWLSVRARDTFRGGTGEVDDGVRLRAFSEAMHRTFEQLMHMVKDESRYPDDVFANVLVDNIKAVRLDPADLLKMLPASVT